MGLQTTLATRQGSLARAPGYISNDCPNREPDAGYLAFGAARSARRIS